MHNVWPNSVANFASIADSFWILHRSRNSNSKFTMYKYIAKTNTSHILASWAYFCLTWFLIGKFSFIVCSLQFTAYLFASYLILIPNFFLLSRQRQARSRCSESGHSFSCVESVIYTREEISLGKFRAHFHQIPQKCRYIFRGRKQYNLSADALNYANRFCWQTLRRAKVSADANFLDGCFHKLSQFTDGYKQTVPYYWSTSSLLLDATLRGWELNKFRWGSPEVGKSFFSARSICELYVLLQTSMLQLLFFAWIVDQFVRSCDKNLNEVRTKIVRLIENRKVFVWRNF